MSTLLTVEGLSKVYHRRTRPDVHALRELTLSVDEGEIFGLLGPNGAGKTTLLKILLGVVHATSGSATLMGHRVPLAASRQRIGFLPESHRFPDYLTGRHLLDVYGRMAGVSASDRAARVPRLLDLVGMGTWADTRVARYSKGMMQRIGLAQALINDPALVFLDEPTDGVDPVGRREIRDLLLQIRGEGRTVFLNSHLLAEVEQVCDRVAILNHGRLVRLDRVDALTAQAYTLVCSPLPPALLARLASAVAPAAPGKPDPTGQTATYRLTAADPVAVNAVLDELRAAGVLIDQLTRRRALEDLFIDVVTEPTEGT
ncbi:MAG: ABC transporter ATP-binding protein [Bacteroidota bacterium]